MKLIKIGQNKKLKYCFSQYDLFSVVKSYSHESTLKQVLDIVCKKSSLSKKDLFMCKFNSKNLKRFFRNSDLKLVLSAKFYIVFFKTEDIFFEFLSLKLPSHIAFLNFYHNRYISSTKFIKYIREEKSLINKNSLSIFILKKKFELLLKFKFFLLLLFIKKLKNIVISNDNFKSSI